MPYYRIYTGKYDESYSCVIFAPTAGKAKSEVLRDWRDFGCEYIYLKARKIPTPAIDFSYFKQYYGLNLKAGTLCKFEGKAGEVVDTLGHYLRVYMKEGYYKGKVITCHPTSEMVYE